MSYRDEYLTRSDFIWDNIDEIQRELDERWETMTRHECMECSKAITSPDDRSAGLCEPCRERLMLESA